MLNAVVGAYLTTWVQKLFMWPAGTKPLYVKHRNTHSLSIMTSEVPLLDI